MLLGNFASFSKLKHSSIVYLKENTSNYFFSSKIFDLLKQNQSLQKIFLVTFFVTLFL